eukprot:1144545-Pelagomonas_calceolata.AAC.7
MIQAQTSHDTGCEGSGQRISKVEQKVFTILLGKWLPNGHGRPSPLFLMADLPQTFEPICLSSLPPQANDASVVVSPKGRTSAVIFQQIQP